MTHAIEYCSQYNSLTNADLDRMKASGARWVRINIDMAFSFPTSGSFSGDTPDWATGAQSAQMTYAKSIGLKVLAMVGFCPGWARISGTPYGNGPPANFTDYGTMCARAYRDLNAVVDAYEIWNEANIVQFWNDPYQTAGTPTHRYRELLRACVNAIRYQAASMGGKTWATPQIWSSGPASSGSGSYMWTDRWDHTTPVSESAGGDIRNVSMPTFLDQLFHSSLGIVPGKTVNTPYVDGYGVHTYTWGTNGVLYDYFENPLKHCFQKTGTIGGVTVGTSPFAFWDDIICAHESYSDPANPPAGFKKLHATENGWPGTDPGKGGSTSYTGVGTEAQVAAYADTIFTFWELYSYRGAGIMNWFQVRDDPLTAGDEVSKWGGLYRLDGSQKPVRTTYRNHALNFGPPSTPGGVIKWGDSSVKWGQPGIGWDGGIAGTGPPGPGPDGSRPVYKIELGLPPTPASAPNSFVIGDATRGVIGNTTYTIGPDVVWHDITNDMQSADSFRGLNEALDRMQPGTLVVQGRDDLVAKGTARHYDPFNWIGPFFPYLRPRTQLRWSVDGVQVWQGEIENIENHHDDAGRTQTVTFSATDSTVRLNHVARFTPHYEQSAHDRLRLILDHARYGRVQLITSGARTYQAGTENTGPAIDQVADIAQAERGLAFTTPGDVFVFFDRAFLESQTPALTFSDDRSAPIRYSHIELQVGTENLYNRVKITGIGDHPKHRGAADLHSEGKFGPKSLELTLPLANIFDMQDLANKLVDDYGDIIIRFKSVTIPTARYSQAIRQQLLGLEIGSAVNVTRTALGVGVPSAVSQVCTIIGIAHRGTPEEFESTFNFTTGIV